MADLFDAAAWTGERLAVGSLQGAVVVALAWAACRWIPRVPAALQAWVWWLVAAKLVVVLLPLPAVPVPLLPASDFARRLRPRLLRLPRAEWRTSGSTRLRPGATPAPPA